MSKFNHKFKLNNSGDTYREYVCDNITARLDFISDSAIRVAIIRNEDVILPTVCVNPESKFPLGYRSRLDTDGFTMSAPQITDDDKIILECGIEITVDTDNFIIGYHKDGKLLFSDREPLAYNFENEFGSGSLHYISRAENEHIYGLGDKSGELDKSGRAFRIETTDCMGYDAHSTDPLYKHIPFYICENQVGCYGLFYDTSDTSYFDFGKEVNNYYEPYKYFKTEDNALVYYVFFGSKMSVIRQFSRLCGKQAFPPKWSFDYCASTMAYTDAPESEIRMNEFLDKVRSLDLNCKGFYLSSGYTSIGNQRYVFNWNRDKFPEPERFIHNFSDNNIEIIPNIKPAFLCDHPMYDMIRDNGWFIKNPDGTPFVTRFWDGLGSYLDFTNKGAYAFWAEQIKDKLLDNGITATWNDNNEFDIKDTDAVAVGFGDGEVSASRIRPVLTYLMVESSYNAQLKENPKLRPFLSSRSGNIAVRRFAQTWSGDNRTDFSDLRYCHYIGLTMSMSGMYFYGHDLGGFSGDMPSRELLLRWLQHGLFEPRFTIHSWNADGSATMPWSYPDIIDSVKALFAQRKRLIPYFYNCAYNAVENDMPINAPLFLYYDDENIKPDCNSFMLGRDILASCVFEEGEDKVVAYLPKGDSWYLDNILYNGGQEVELSIPPTAPMPYFVRSGCVLPTDDGEEGFDKDEKLVFTVYPVEEGSFESRFFTDDGLTFKYLDNECVMLEFIVSCDKNSVNVTYSNFGNMDIPFEIKLINGDTRAFNITKKTV